MKNSKSSWPRDRLSELPESLIFHIFWLLPMRDVVRTTILSKQWKNLWTTTPFLNFSFYENMLMDIVQVRNFINRALILWEGMKIQKFKIDLHGMDDESICSDFDVWVYSALRKEVQELYVHNPCDYEAYLLPQYLYSCSSLKVLSLVDCRLEINGNVQWNQLQSLTFRGGLISEHAINQVLCGSPRLEVFIFNRVHDYENLSFRSSSLKRLSIENNADDCDHSLKIWTPNLETLELLGAPYCECLLMDASSLTHVTLDFDSHHPLVDATDLIEDALLQIFPTIQHVENVTISDCCIMVLADMIKKGLIPSSSNAKFLKLNNSWVQYEQIVEVLDIFPKLKMLLLEGDTKVIFQHVGESLEFDANLPKSFLLHLRTVEITCGGGGGGGGGGGHLIFPFIKIVLKYASKLEKMVIRVASHKLLPMRISSPHCKVYIITD